VAETLEFLEPQARARDLELGAEVPAGLQPVEADASRLRQILLNLVGNALKFTEHGGVRVRVVADPATGRPLRLDVIDTGIGIPADRLEAVFERFQQVDGTTERRYGGTGLGLAISRQLARLMGFGLGVQSVVGRGSTFSLHFGGPTA
jgi:signal transduction histidine kinase